MRSTSRRYHRLLGGDIPNSEFSTTFLLDHLPRSPAAETMPVDYAPTAESSAGDGTTTARQRHLAAGSFRSVLTIAIRVGYTTTAPLTVGVGTTKGSPATSTAL